MVDKCWLKTSLEEEECPNIDPATESHLLQDQKARMKAKCLECPKLMMDLVSCEAPHKMAIELLPRVLEEDQSGIQFFRDRLEQSQHRLKALSEVAALIRDSTNLDDIIYTILTYITAGDGLGYNRAWMLLVDRGFLKGYWAIGPRDPKEALEIWDCITSERCSVHELLERKGALYRDRERLSPILETLVFPLDDREPLMKLLKARKAVIIGRDSCPELASLLDLLGVQYILVLPLWSGENLLGCILVDNVVSAEPFHPVDVRAMDTFAAQAALAIERASLYRSLENKVMELESWSQEMSCQQESLTKLEKMAAVGVITSKVAHEIRNPVTAIGGLANYLIKSGESDERILKTIVEESRRLEDLVKDLIAFADSTCPSKTRLDLRTVLKMAVEEAEKTLNSTSHSIHLSLDPHPLMLRVDPKHIRALVWNLMKNALEAMPEGGDVSISLKKEGERTVLEVSDQGTGIAPELLEEVRKPSFSTKGGTGMGLPICLNVVEEYNGKLEITSSDKGTTVRVELPLGESIDESAGDERDA